MNVSVLFDRPSLIHCEKATIRLMFPMTYKMSFGSRKSDGKVASLKNWNHSCAPSVDCFVTPVSIFLTRTFAICSEKHPNSSELTFSTFHTSPQTRERTASKLDHECTLHPTPSYYFIVGTRWYNECPTDLHTIGRQGCERLSFLDRRVRRPLCLVRPECECPGGHGLWFLCVRITSRGDGKEHSATTL